MERDDDPVLVPLRIAWLAPRRDGTRSVRLADLLKLGDPRDPDLLRQYLIMARAPDRCQILVGEPARSSELITRWQEGVESSSLSDFVARRAWLALERAERHVRGNRYKVPKFVHQEILGTSEFRAGVVRFAGQLDKSEETIFNRASRYLREIAATHDAFTIDLVANAIHWLYRQGYGSIHYEPQAFREISTLGQTSSLVFLPSHKSNLDHLVLQYVLWENDAPPNHTAGGINMNFFPLGPLLRRSGVFFIRREFKDNEPYKFVLREYIDYLLEKRFPLEWYLEGGRSRSGKLRAPRLGMLSYVVDSARRGSVDDVIFIPVSIAYDQIQDVGSYASEAAGGRKQSESLGWLLRAVRSLRRRYGRAHLRFGAPLSLDTFLRDQPELPTDLDDRRSPIVPKLGFEISNRINEVTPITPISLVTLALLSVHDRSLTLDEVMAVLGPYLEYVRARNLPTTEKLALDEPDRVRAALDSLTDHGVVSRFQGATATVYAIGHDQHLAAAYYRNTIIHHFITAAITELALIAVHRGSAPASESAVLDQTLAIRDLLKFEFFFAPTDEFIDQIKAELDFRDPQWRAHLAAGQADTLLLAFQPFQSEVVMRPFFEAYRVIGDLIEADAYTSQIDIDGLRRRAMDLGKQYVLQGRIHSEESVSQVLFDAAISVAENRKLFVQGPDIVERRIEFANELRQTVAHLRAIDALTTVIDAGLPGIRH